MTRTLTATEAKARILALLDEAAAGEEIDSRSSKPPDLRRTT